MEVAQELLFSSTSFCYLKIRSVSMNAAIDGRELLQVSLELSEAVKKKDRTCCSILALSISLSAIPSAMCWQ
jgi:hypothetical protein